MGNRNSTFKDIVKSVDASVKSNSISEKYAVFLEQCKELDISSYSLNTIIHYAQKNNKDKTPNIDLDKSLFVSDSETKQVQEKEKEIVIKEVVKKKWNWTTCIVTALVMSVIWYLFLTTNDAKRGANESIGFDVNGAKFTMKYVEGGRFMMGASASDTIAKTWEKPAHSVILDDYYIGETEVSQALWKAVMNNNPSKHVGDNYPVDCVSWDDCMDFCKKLSSITGYYFCLPTEAEWEFAARGGNKSNNYKYSGSNNLNEVAWCLDDSDTISHVVKTKKPNELGVYDMTGNVWEWCYDYWNNQYESYSGFSQINPHGTPSGEFRVHRGGAWHSSSKYCRVSYRWYAKAERHNDFRGFRLAMHLPRNQ